MEAIRSAATAICTALISLGIMSVLIPSGKNKKTVSTVFGICTVLAVALPLSGGFSVSLTETQADAWAEDTRLAQTAVEQMTELSAGQVELEALQILKQGGVENCEIAVKMDISENGGIFIEYITVSGELLPEAQDKVKLLLSSAFSIEKAKVEVKNSG